MALSIWPPRGLHLSTGRSISGTRRHTGGAVIGSHPVGIHLAKASTGSHLVGIHLVGIHLMGMSLAGAFNERASYAPGFCNKKPN